MLNRGRIMPSDAHGSTSNVQPANLSFAPAGQPCASDTFGQAPGVFVCPTKSNKEGAMVSRQTANTT